GCGRGSSPVPETRRYFSAIACRRTGAPHVTAYWLMSPLIAVHAAAFIASGIAKSGNPCARFTALCMAAIRVISRITDSVNVEVRRAASTCLLPLGLRLASNFAERSANEIGRLARLSTIVQRRLDRTLGVWRRIAQRFERANGIVGARYAPAGAAAGSRNM